MNQKNAIRFKTTTLLPNDPECSLESLRTTMQPLVSTILSSNPYYPPTNTVLLRETLTNLALYAQRLEKELSKHSSSSSFDDRSPSSINASASGGLRLPMFSDPQNNNQAPATADDDPEMAGLTDSLQHLLVVDTSKNRFFGPSSSVMLAKTAIEFSSRTKSALDATKDFGFAGYRRPEFWTVRPWEVPPTYIALRQHQIFPDPDLLQDLIQLYFDHMHPFLPILHGPTFKRSVQAGLHFEDHRFGEMVLALCALASRYSHDPRIILEGTNSEYSCGWKWFRQLRFFHACFVQAPCLYEIQTYCMAILYLHGTSIPETCWYILGLAVRAAQDVGIHRRKPTLEGGVPTIEDELSKRVFWVLIAIDTILCANVGRPRATGPFDCNLDLPIECDDEYMENSDPSLAFKQPPGKPSKIAYFNAHIKLLLILGSAQRTIYAVKKREPRPGKTIDEWNQEIVTALDSALNSWADSIPDHLRWDPCRTDPLHSDQSAVLYALYYYVQILVHRPFITPRANPTSLTFSSLAICTNAARACSRIMKAQSRRAFLPIPQVQVAMFTSGLVILLNIWGGKQLGVTFEQSKQVEAVHNCINVLRVFEHRWHAAGRFCDILLELSAVSDLPVPVALEAKRKRDGEFCNTGPTCSNSQNSPFVEGDFQGPDSYPAEVTPSEGFLYGPGTGGSPSALPLYSDELSQNIFLNVDLQPSGSSSLQHDGLAADGSLGFSSPSPASLANMIFSDHTGFAMPELAKTVGLQTEEAVNILPGLSNQPEATDFDMAVWTSVPNGNDWAQWSAYIATVEGLMQEPQAHVM